MFIYWLFIYKALYTRMYILVTCIEKLWKHENVNETFNIQDKISINIQQSYI